ncbi:sensor histidine kinase [Streptomyces sp. NPDC002285]
MTAGEPEAAVDSTDRRLISAAVRWLRREAGVSRAALRTASRRTVAVDASLSALTAVLGLLPLLLVHPQHPVPAVLQALWAALLVALRRGRPVAAVVGAAPLVMGGNVWTLPVIALIVLSATRRIAPSRRAWQVVGAACAVLGALTVAVGLFRWEHLPRDLADNAISAALLLLLPALSGTLLGRRRPLTGLLRERNAYLEQTRTLTAEAARLEERTRIAGEMHDLLGHRLSLISVHAGALELAAARQAPPLVGQVELLRTTAGTAMEELREILGVLRRAELADAMDPTDGSGNASASERGTREDITALVAQSRQAGGGPVELDWSVPDTAEAGARARQAIHRVVREGLTNVLKHASGAPTRVEVRSTDAGIEVDVTNGPPREAGRSQGGTHSGLAGLHERISLLGGSFGAGPLPDGGFRVTARLPTDAIRSVSGPLSAISAGPLPPPGGAHAPLSTEVLTWPRVLGAGCASVLVVLPTAGFLVVVLLAALR